MNFKNLMTHWLAAIFFALLVGCGGSGSDEGGDGSVPPTWTANVFEDESEFKNLCQVPRTGTDPATNRAYAD